MYCLPPSAGLCSTRHHEGHHAPGGVLRLKVAFMPGRQPVLNALVLRLSLLSMLSEETL